MSVKTKPIGTGITIREEIHVEGTQGGAGLAEVAEEQRGHAALFAGAAADPRDKARAACAEIAGDRREKWLAAAKRMATAKTDEEREDRYAELQTAVDEIRKQNPTASKAEVRRIVMEETGASNSMLRRHTIDAGK